MDIRHSFFNFHHGQSDERLYISVAGEVVAALDYSVYEGQPAIKMIEVRDRRRGYARALLMRLQSLYPDEEIDWGSLTDDGAKLKAGMKFRNVVDPVMKAKNDLLDRVRKKITKLEQDVTPDNIKQYGELWNRLYDMERRLEDELAFGKISKSIIVG